MHSLVLIEDLHPDKSIENQRIKLEDSSRVTGITQDSVSCKVKDECYHKLVNCLANNHLPHVDCNQRSRLWIRLSIQDRWSRRICGQRKCSKCIHDKIHPEKLHSGQNGCFIAGSNCRDKGKKYSSNVDRELKLETN